MLVLILLVSCAKVPPTAVPSSANPPALRATEDSGNDAPGSEPAHEITVDLSVHSKHRQPVPNLEAAQLSVLDGGAPVPLRSLRRVEVAAARPRAIEFLFDRLDPRSARSARSIAQRVLGVIPDTGYSLAVLRCDPSLRLLQGYTRDFRRIDAALTEATPVTAAQPAFAATSAENELFESRRKDALSSDSTGGLQRKELSIALQESRQILEDHHSYPSLAALQALVSSDRLLPDRKFLFFFTEAVAAASDARERLQSIVSLANRAGVTIYVVDVGALPAAMRSEMQASDASQFLGAGGAAGNLNAFGVGKGTTSGAPAAIQRVLAHNIAGFEFGDIRSAESPVVSLAAGTGGEIAYGESGARSLLLHLHEDLTSWYEASWVPPFKRYDGQFRPLEFRSIRKDLVLHARTGYFAVSPDRDGVLPFEEPLLNLLKQAHPPAELAVQTGVLHLGPSSDGGVAEIVVQVPVSQLQPHQDGNTHLTSVDTAIVAVIRDSKGIVVDQFGEHFPLREAPSVFERPGQSLTLERSFVCQPGTYTLEAVAMDLVGKKAGVQRTQFTVEVPTSGVSLSDIALVQTIEPVEAEAREDDPMRSTDGRIIPRLATDLPADTNSLSFFFLLHPAAGGKQQPDLRMQVSRGGHLLTEAPMPLRPVFGTSASVPYLANLKGAALAPGSYTATVLMTQDGKTATSSTKFLVADTSSPSKSSVAIGPPDAAAAAEALVLTPLKQMVPPPTADEIHAMLEDASSRALAWSDSLQNFLCLEVTDHFVNAPSDHDWRHKATYVEMMRYVDHAQTRTPLLLNGEPTSVQPDRLEFAHSNGEFGAVFHVLFDPSAHAVITWKETTLVEGQSMHVFSFRIARPNSGFLVSDRENHTRAVGFQGLFFLEPMTRSIRRVMIVADDIPQDLAIHASSMTLEYAFLAMQNHDFLLPVRGSVTLQETGKQPVLNQFEFHDYHRFGSEVRIHAREQHDPPPASEGRP